MKLDCFRLRSPSFGGLPARRSLHSKRRRVVASLLAMTMWHNFRFEFQTAMRGCAPAIPRLAFARVAASRCPSEPQLGDSRILALGGKSIAVEGCGETSPALAHSFWPWWLVVAIPTAETGCNPGYEGKRAWRVRIFLP